MWLNWHKLLQTTKWVSLFVHSESSFFVTHMLEIWQQLLYIKHPYGVHKDIAIQHHLYSKYIFCLEYLCVFFFFLRSACLAQLALHKNMLTNSIGFKTFWMKRILGNMVRNYAAQCLFLKVKINLGAVLCYPDIFY